MSSEIGPSGKVIVELLCGSLAKRFTPALTRLTLSYAAVGDATHSRVKLYERDGTAIRSAFPTVEESELLRRLRAASYVPGRGTWWSLVLEVEGGGTFTARINRDDRPHFGSDPVGPRDYAEEARRYPRASEYSPDWFLAEVARADRMEGLRAQ